MTIKKSDSSGVPFGNNAGRPANPGIGRLYSNGEEKRLELYTSTGWQNIVSETPGVVSVSGNYVESAGSGTLEITGTNFTTGAIASVIGTNGVEVNANSTTVNSIVSVTAVFSGLSNANEPYDIKVTNTSNLFGLLPDALYINASPVWQTASGSLGTFNEQVSITLSALSATDPENTTVTYDLANGSSLPSGFTLNSTSGVISGTLPDISSDTTYNFTVNASDGYNITPRSFSLTSVSQVDVELLVIAGGGGGGSNGNTTGGGGGGAGGYLYSTSTSFDKTTPYTLTIGAGGTGRQQSVGSPSSGNKGENSSISGSGITAITAIGGGGGVSNQSGGTLADANGGSGGGDNYGNTAGTGTAGQGNNGGESDTSGNNGYISGGGGSYAEVGKSNLQGGHGGSATTNSITGTSTLYAAGGGAGCRSGGTAGSGGSGIGGNGRSGSGNGFNASPSNTGSGGGGGGGEGNNSSYIGGTGSDGVIIIAYPDNHPAASIGAGLTYDQPTRSGYRVYRFTAGSGTITI